MKIHDHSTPSPNCSALHQVQTRSLRLLGLALVVMDPQRYLFCIPLSQRKRCSVVAIYARYSPKNNAGE